MINFSLATKYLKNSVNVDLIFIFGKIGAGKDVAANFLRDSYGFSVFKYGDIIKEMMGRVGWDGKKDLKSRKLMLDIGKAFRTWDSEIFIKTLVTDTVTEIKRQYSYTKLQKWANQRIVVSDARFPYEVTRYQEMLTDHVKSVESVVIQILGSNYDHTREMDQVVRNDATEISMENFIPDFCILNEPPSTLEDLYSRLRSIVKTIFSY